MTLSSYLALDLSADGPAAGDLIAGVERERGRSTVALSRPGGATAESPGLFTPEMMRWYQAHVAPVRQGALAEARGGFEADRLPSGQPGFLREAELDRVDQSLHENLKSEREAFYTASVGELNAEIARLGADYGHKSAEHGRDAHELKPVRYVAVLVILGLIEGLVNWDSFLKIDWFTPAYALAAFLAVAIGFACSSHYVGLVLKQWSETFSGAAPRHVKREALTRLGFGVLLFSLGMALVYYSRNYLIQIAVERAEALGQPVGFGLYLGLFGAFAANLLFYGVGVAWSYSSHDAVPDFAEERRRLDTLKRRRLRLYGKQLEPRQRQHLLAARKDSEQVERRDAEQRLKLRNYGAHRDRFEQLQTADARALALLEGYRSRLIDAGRGAGLNVTFAYDDPSRPEASTHVDLTPDAYALSPLRLAYR
ncbi:hypothetical protein GCM10008171_13110 [Methylopila jiangsuensis]|uniref:Uncharacterized protein n=1 Tax=Methylopila jiangsuensis TaxID=586230 RepID=A0A9W6JFF0_9HYPH|nr:hypothetical protein [Methylopila jiangsuensis]MDR6286294.1 hypothetical protein [Methylopila jiangsuensis]GLK76057.1 hypothetical protein GCM10008171_13110 [Methylopila jiangsuensis]